MVTETESGCTCPKECDCEFPPSDEITEAVTYLVSNLCPIHNLYPDYMEGCPIHDID